MTRLHAAGLVLTWAILALPACGAAPVAVEMSGDRVAVPVTLRLTEAPDEGEVPRTSVQLVILWPDMAREVVDLGPHEGACRELIPSGDVLVEVECWWGPSQAHLSLVQVGDQVQVESRRADSERVTVILTHVLRQSVRLVALGEINPDELEDEPGLLP